MCSDFAAVTDADPCQPVREYRPLVLTNYLRGLSGEALYYTNQWAGNGVSAWLERCFMLPAHLDIAVSQARLITRGSAPGRGGVYRDTRGGFAVLSLVFAQVLV